MSALEWPLGAIELKVLDLERVVAFYESFGLARFSGDASHAVMGVDGPPLLRLTALPEGRERPPHTAGLFHHAILLPSEEQLGGFLRRALEARLPLTGTADHLVSQALYFDDVEGNGIEVYADRPRSEWQYPNGRLNIGIEHLDFERLLRIAAPSEKHFSGGTVLGHMHLNVGDLEASQAFYELSWDGYHHHLGINLLEGRDAAPVEPGVRGLRSFEIRRLDVARTDPNGILLTPPL